MLHRYIALGKTTEHKKGLGEFQGIQGYAAFYYLQTVILGSDAAPAGLCNDQLKVVQQQQQQQQQHQQSQQ